MKPAFIICMLLLGMGCKKDPQQHLYLVKCKIDSKYYKTSTLNIDLQNEKLLKLSINGTGYTFKTDSIEYRYWNEFPNYTTIDSKTLYTYASIIYTVYEDGKKILMDSVFIIPTATDTTYFKEYFTENKNR